MSDSFRVQQNVKIGNDLINLRADSTEEFTQIAQWAVANAALFVNVQAALTSVPPALAPNVAHTQVQQAPAYQEQTGGWANNQPPGQQGPQEPQTSWGQPQQSPPPQFAQPASNAPMCRHGERQYKSGTSKAGKDYKMWACPSSNRQDQCEPQWVR